jgi:hypothetical protein
MLCNKLLVGAVAMFKRPHHQRIAHVLTSLDGEILAKLGCYFGGGTCIALRFGEYRESVDIDFLVSDATGYRELRQLLTGTQGLVAITRQGAMPLVRTKEIRADQYGIRTQLMMNLTLPQLRAAIDKSVQAYGATIGRDLAKAIERMEHKTGWLERCMQAMAMDMPDPTFTQR